MGCVRWGQNSGDPELRFRLIYLYLHVFLECCVTRVCVGRVREQVSYKLESNKLKPDIV